jgi:HPt (histidine-containing phosphotransfer) domain-containing protein
MSDEVIDLAVFSELCATAGAEFVADLVATFCDDAADILVQLREAAEVGDAAKYKRAAHSLKSNANTFGAARLAAVAREIELGGLSADAATKVANLGAEFERAARRLKELAHGGT